MRVLAEAEQVAHRLQHRLGPNMAKYSKRKDLDGGHIEF